MDHPLSPEALRAFLTPIAHFRAVKGSYELSDIRQVSYQKSLTDEEWKMCVAIYNEYLAEEIKRNQDQQDKHRLLQAHLAPKIERLKEIVLSIPEIEDVFLVNSYVSGALKPTSDIDLLVITQPKVLWWARLKLTAKLEVAGMRRKPGCVEEQFCLSFLVTRDHLDMSKIALKDDIHLAYWSTQIQSLLHRSEAAWWQQNTWLNKIFPSFDTTHQSLQTVQSHPVSMASRIGNALVKIPLKIRHHYRSKHLGPDSSIVISDTMLKFHNEDRRTLYREKTLSEVQMLESIIMNAK